MKKVGMKYKEFEKSFRSEETKKIFLMNQLQPHFTLFDEEYPKYLKEISFPPIVLFYTGDLNCLKGPSISIVGAREATSYSFDAIRDLVNESVLKQYTIVSGMASGVDYLAHQRALASKNGKTIAVMGTGLGGCYPKNNLLLKQHIEIHGLVLTEYVLGSKPLPFHFVERNRIIAGLSQKTLVIEAKEHSGSLITANFALEENREVFATPGSVCSELSKGCNELIKAGARPCLSSQDLLEESLI